MFKINKRRHFARINIEYDSNLEKQKTVEVSGDEETIASLLGTLMHKLIDSGFDAELLEHSVMKGLKDANKKTNTIEVKEIHISKENEDEFKQLLEKIMKGEK